MHKAPAVLIVGINVTQTRDALRRAEALGLKVYLADSPAKLAQHADLFTATTTLREVDFEAPDQVVDLVGEVRKESDLKGVIALEEYALRSVAIANARFSMIGTSVATVRSCLSKFAARQILADAGLPSINFSLGHGIQDIYGFGEDHGYPLIIKPDGLKASIGVYKVAAKDEVAALFGRLTEHVDPSRGFMIEEFLGGSEFSTEGLVYRGDVKIWSATEKLLVPGTPVEGGHLTPFDNPVVNDEFLQEYVTRICNALGIGFGPFHIESYIVDDKVIVGEVHTRYGGDQISTITQLSRGCDFHTPLYCEMADLPYDLAVPDPQSMFGVFYLCAQPGTLRKVRIDDAFGTPDVIQQSITKQPGDLIGPIENSYDRAGWFIVEGSSREELLKKAEMYSSMVEFETDPHARA